MLREAQQAIAAWIRAPEGVAAALVEADRRADDAGRGAERRRLEAIVRSDATLSATDRLEIYANAYFHRILGVLRDDYPALAARLGEAAFNDLVTSYLLVRPSRHPSLRHVGGRLPGFLRDHALSSDLRSRAPWAADLARLEWARVEVFDAPDGRALDRADLADLPPEAITALGLRLGAWARPGAYDHPVDRLWREAISDGGPDGPPAPGADGASVRPPLASAATAKTHLLVWRRRETVVHRRIDADEAAALATVEAGIRFDDLCEAIAARAGEAEAPGRAAAWLEQWLADGILRAEVSLSAGDDSRTPAAD